MSILHGQIETDGRVKLPAQIMKDLDLETGDDVEFHVESGSVRLVLSTRERVRRVQERMKKYTWPGRSVVDEFIAEKRLEAENE